MTEWALKANDEYWDLHERLWSEAARVLADDGIFVPNTSDFIRNGEVVSITDRQVEMLERLGLDVMSRSHAQTQRMRRGSRGTPA